jgi:hypothetical protein
MAIELPRRACRCGARAAPPAGGHQVFEERLHELPPPLRREEPFEHGQRRLVPVPDRDAQPREEHLAVAAGAEAERPIQVRELRRRQRRRQVLQEVLPLLGAPLRRPSVGRRGAGRRRCASASTRVNASGAGCVAFAGSPGLYSHSSTRSFLSSASSSPSRFAAAPRGSAASSSAGRRSDRSTTAASGRSGRVPGSLPASGGTRRPSRRRPSRGRVRVERPLRRVERGGARVVRVAGDLVEQARGVRATRASRPARGRAAPP